MRTLTGVLLKRRQLQPFSVLCADTQARVQECPLSGMYMHFFAYTYRYTDTDTYAQAYTCTYRLTYVQTDRQTQTDRQAGRQTDRPTYIIHTSSPLSPALNTHAHPGHVKTHRTHAQAQVHARGGTQDHRHSLCACGWEETVVRTSATREC